MILKVLGTVSPYCKGTLKCPGFLIKSNNNNILLDCGSGITSNMNLPTDLNNLSIIISHLHRDHYSDIFSIAYASYVYHNLNILKNKIRVYIPTFDKDSEKDYELITNLGEEQYLEIITYDNNSIINLENTTISFSSNPHNITSHSIKISEDNKTLVYSGDTGYIENSIEKFAAGVNLLICESTFLKNQQRKKDFHLYAYEAAKIAKNAQVKQLLLTHFWPEIDKQEYLNEALPIFSNTDVTKEQQVLILK